MNKSKHFRHTLVESKIAGFPHDGLQYKKKQKLYCIYYIVVTIAKQHPKSVREIPFFVVIRGDKIDLDEQENMKQFNVLLADLKHIKHINHKP